MNWDTFQATLQAFQKEIQEKLKNVSTLEEWQELYTRCFGRQKGVLKQHFKNLKHLDPSDRPRAGKLLNEIKLDLEKRFENIKQKLEEQALEERLEEEKLDPTLPGTPSHTGGFHPIRLVQQRIEKIFERMGYAIADGPEIENEYYNFSALNFPSEHPARDTQDTFYLYKDYLLRTHTSPVQIRVMQQYPPPIKVIIPGKVYRHDEPDASHAPVFHQIEGLVVDKGIRFSDLKGTLESFLQELFGEQCKMRFRPSYFPFTEPSAEVDMSCLICDGRGCSTCKESGWLEVLGAGMVHPNVLREVGLDPEIYTGFAFGLGIERLAMLMFGIPDIRLFLQGDIRFLSQFHTPLLD